MSAPGPARGTAAASAAAPSPSTPVPDGAPHPERSSHLVDSVAFRRLGGLIIPLVVLGVWQLVTVTGLVPPYRLPTPGSIWQAALDMAANGDLWLFTAISTQRVLLGFAIGAALGLVIGAVVGLSRLGDILLTPSLSALRAVPSLAWVPLLILWLQIGEESKITLIAIGSFFPVYTTVSAALKHVDPQIIEAGRAFGLRGVRLLTTVQLPAVLPSVVAGLRLALAQAWLFLVAAELIASSMGLGFLLTESGANGRVDRMFLAIILLALLGTLTDSIIGLLQRRVLSRWS
ncbi:sulfonate transport system permease protein [Serinibacter salmoneus]|uniref:Sulfonate transport system permease protein n=1 Tax=Serinibacter salmoneus TaxID=556530 RepID=A0A2A9D460_9MICO|nr:sulfonate transport system permease protein [Serinibacter salmoneus]